MLRKLRESEVFHFRHPVKHAPDIEGRIGRHPMTYGPDDEGWVRCSTYPAFDVACSGCRGRGEMLYFLHLTFHTVKMDCLQYCANFPAKSEKYANLAFNILCWALWGGVITRK